MRRLQRRDRGRITRTGWVMVVWFALSALFSVASAIGIIWLIVHFAHKYW